MKKFLPLLVFVVIFSLSSSFGQTCATLVYPANEQKALELKYDRDTMTVRSNVDFNGVLAKWNKMPGVSQYKVFMKPSLDGAGWWQVYPGSTTDTVLTLPTQYGTYYEWYVVGNGATCASPEIFNFTTAPPPPFCKPTCNGGGQWDWVNYGVTTFSLAGEVNVTAYDFAGPCYNYFNNTNAIPELIPGNSYPLKFWVDFGGTIKCYIDFNNNGYFETNEKVDAVKYDEQENAAYQSFYIPLSATTGTHRMRILLGTDPCDIGGGAISDIYVRILNAQQKKYGIAEVSAKNQCLQVTTANFSFSNTEWRQLVDASGKIVAAINANGNDLGIVTVKVYENDGPIRTLPNNNKVMDRSVEITPSIQPLTPVDVRLYFSKTEFDALKEADNNVGDLSSINISKFSSSCGQPTSGYKFIGQTTSGVIDSFYYVQFSTTSFSDFYLRGGSDDLPVSFVALNAKRVGNSVTITWETATEADCKGFNVEYSTDGIQFNAVTFVGSHAINGNSNSLLSYSYNHIGALPTAGYYRIQQIDENGKTLYSGVANIKAISDKKLELVKLFPNPTKGKTRLKILSDEPQNIVIEVLNMEGMLLQQQKNYLVTGNNKIELLLEGIPAGAYMVTVKDGEGRKLAFSKVIKY